jgi:hypothetical protein
MTKIADLNFAPVTDIAAVDLAIHLIGKEGIAPETVYESMCDAVPDLKAKGHVAFEQHLFAMGYVLSLMHVRQAFAAPTSNDVN